MQVYESLCSPDLIHTYMCVCVCVCVCVQGVVEWHSKSENGKRGAVLVGATEDLLEEVRTKLGMVRARISTNVFSD